MEKLAPHFFVFVIFITLLTLTIIIFDSDKLYTAEINTFPQITLEFKCYFVSIAVYLHTVEGQCA